MASLLPVWPDEAEDWLDLPPGTAVRWTHRPEEMAKLWKDWAPPTEQIARNECLLGLAD
jgi:hypothetical protein